APNGGRCRSVSYRGKRPSPAAGKNAPGESKGTDSTLGGQGMSIIMTIIIGFIVGLVARFLMPGRDPMGFILTTLLGIVGALLASWVGQARGWYAWSQAAGFIGSVIGAIIVLLCYHVFRHRPALE